MGRRWDDGIGGASVTVPLTVPSASAAAAAAEVVPRAGENQRDTAPPVLVPAAVAAVGGVGAMVAGDVEHDTLAGAGVVTAGALVSVCEFSVAAVTGCDASGVFSPEGRGYSPAVPGVGAGALVFAYPMPPQVCLLAFVF